MRLSGKMKNNTTTTNNEGWGLGLFLVFFPDTTNNIGDNNSNPTTTSTTKKTLSSSTSFPSLTNHHHHHQLFYKAQSTISICVILVVFTFLLFTLSNFDSSISQTSHTNSSPRRWLSDQQKVKDQHNDINSSSPKALQGMGTLFRRGTRAMNDLIVAHLPEDMNRHNFLVFMRILHLSGITSKADVVLLSSSLSTFNRLIHQENESFLKILSSAKYSNAAGFNFTHFTKQSSGGETLWGKKVHSSSNHSNLNNSGAGDTEPKVNKLNYGSVVGFEVSELDPADTLSGFLEHIPIRLRRWACYPMLLGRLRRNFKHIMLIDANDVIPLGDPLSKIRHKGAESVHLWRNSEKTRAHDKKDTKSINADVIVGGMRGVRLLSNAVLNEIVRVAMKKKTKTPVTDSVILSQIVNNESLLKSSNVDASVGSSLPNANSVISMISSSSSSSSMWLSSLGMLHRESSSQNVDVNHILHRQICTSVIDTFIYRDCYKRNIN